MKTQGFLGSLELKLGAFFANLSVSTIMLDAMIKEVTEGKYLSAVICGAISGVNAFWTYDHYMDLTQTRYRSIGEPIYTRRRSKR